MNPDPTSLDRLHDIVSPPPTPWWPPAPGWYWLGGFLLFILLVATIRFIASWQANCYRREALREWSRHALALQRTDSRTGAIVAMAGLLKRTALTVFPRERVASLSGPEWLSFLDRTGRSTGFSQGPGFWLEKIAYDPRCAGSISNDDARLLAETVRRWLLHHRIDLASEERR